MKKLPFFCVLILATIPVFSLSSQQTTDLNATLIVKGNPIQCCYGIGSVDCPVSEQKVQYYY
jgi:hypothetical protein